MPPHLLRRPRLVPWMGRLPSPPGICKPEQGPLPHYQLANPVCGDGHSPPHKAPSAGPETQGGDPKMQLALPLSPPESHPVLPSPVPIASGEKGKARDILAAIRTLKTIEHDHRPATPEERQTLARFAGFGPVALSIFPDPVTGRYKDGWQALGDELKSLLTPEEYDSAKRTTFNAFYTSPTVIAAMHQALTRLGVPGNATILEPGCGVGNFMNLAGKGTRFIGVEMDSISGRIARALHPGHDIRIENFRDTKLARERNRRGDRQRALRRPQARLSRPETVAARFLLRQVSGLT